MVSYVLKRILYMAFVFVILSFLMYSIYNLIPGDPARAQLESQKEKLKPDAYEMLYRELRKSMGLDDPIPLRYARWMGLAPLPPNTVTLNTDGVQGLSLTHVIKDEENQQKLELDGITKKRFISGVGVTFHLSYRSAEGKTEQWSYTFDADSMITMTISGNDITFVSDRYRGMFQGYLGYSNVFKQPVSEILGTPMKNTVFMNIFSVALALGITIPLGIFCAVRKGSRFDNGVQVGTIVGYSVPVFITAIVFIWLFAVILRIFPVGGMKTPGSNYSGLRELLDRLYYLALPLITMTFAALGGMTRYVRAAMIDALGMDYIRTARAKGLREKVVVYSHAWRNALLPVITLIIGWFLSIFGGSVIIERTFSYNGLGKLYIDSLLKQDFEVVLALQMFYVIISLFGNLLIDLSYGLVDPRIRVNK